VCKGDASSLQSVSPQRSPTGIDQPLDGAKSVSATESNTAGVGGSDRV